MASNPRVAEVGKGNHAEILPACAVTRAMSRAAIDPVVTFAKPKLKAVIFPVPAFPLPVSRGEPGEGAKRGSVPQKAVHPGPTG